MSWIGDLFKGELSHTKNLFSQMGDKPWKTGAQFLLGAGDPLSAKMWSGITGTKFTPLVGQLGGETQAQFDESARQGVNVKPVETMGGIANAIAGYEAGGYFNSSGSLGSLFAQGAEKLDGTSATEGETTAETSALLGLYDKFAGSSASTDTGNGMDLSSFDGLFGQLGGSLSGKTAAPSSGYSGGGTNGGGGGDGFGDSPDYFTSLFNFGPGSVKTADQVNEPITLASPNYSAMLLNGMG